MIFFVVMILSEEILSQNCRMYTSQSACPTTGSTVNCGTDNFCFWNATLGMCLDNGCRYGSNCMSTSSTLCNQAGCFWNTARGFCSYIGINSGYSCAYNNQSTCPSTGSTTCATGNNCSWNITLGMCLDNGCSHNSDCMYNSALTCNQPGCSWNSVLGICSYVGYCEQYTSPTACPTDNTSTCGTSGKNRCSWSTANSLCYDNGCSQNNPCLTSSNITCSSLFGCTWNINGFCYYSGSSTPATCLQSSSVCSACKGSQNLCFLKSPYCFYSSKTCINSSTAPTCSGAGVCSVCLSQYDCTTIQSKCVWNSVNRTCSSTGSCSEVTTELACNQSSLLCSWSAGTCKTCNSLNGCSACRSSTDCTTKDPNCSWDGSKGLCFQSGIVASHLKATITVLNSTVGPNSTVYDSSTSDPDQFVEIEINGIAYRTPHCTDSLVCTYTTDNVFSWDNIPINDKGWTRLYDHNESPRAHKLIMMDDITVLDWVGRGLLVLYSYNLLNTTRVYILMHAEGQCADPFFVSNAQLTQCTLQDCNLRTPINGTCFAGVADTSMCFIQPAGAPHPCATTCPTFYTVQADQCVPQTCTARIPVDSKCRSLDDTMPEKRSCGYWPDTRTCIFCPPNHYQGDSQGVCVLKACASRMVNTSVAFTCAEDICNEQINGTCATGCPAAHTTIDSRGRCVKKLCTSRTVNASQPYTCGDLTCNEQPNNEGCAEGCPSAHFEVGDKGRCVIKSCLSRLVNASATYTCGDLTCNEQKEGGCKPGCSLAHYKVDSKGRCELISPCTSRTVNESAYYTCGDLTCNEQPNGGCAEGCPSLHFEPDIVGKCVLKSCSSRAVNPTATYPCAESTCYEQPNGAGCDLACPEDHFQIEIDGKGKCVLRPCVERKKNTSATYACGENSCNLQADDYSCAKGCPGNFEIGPKGVCVLISCSNRTIDTEGNYTCGDAECNQQPDGSGCALGCHPAEHYTPGDRGICELISNCSERAIASTENYTCGADCYLEPTGSCGESCPDKHYEVGDKGICVLKDCVNRTADPTESSTCGSNTCNEQPDGTCSEGCLSSSHYMVGVKDKCQLIPLCTGRTVNASAEFTCGDAECNEQPEGGCAEGCPADHYEVGPKGVCILKPLCSARRVNSSAFFKCGSSDCFQQRINGGIGDGVLGTVCDEGCDPALYSTDSSNGTCELLECANRTANSSLPFPCGTWDCFQQIRNGGDEKGQFDDSCKSSCNPLLFSTSTSTGTCEFLDCAARRSDESLPFPCGSTDCYQQLYGDGNPTGECGTSCDSALFLTDNTTGRCVLLDCPLRKAITDVALSMYPCGTPECYQQIRNNELGVGYESEFCDTTCDPPAFYNIQYIKGTASTGKCVLKECVKRTAIDTALPFPCGTSDCYPLGNGSCSEILCSFISVCNKSPGCKTNTDESVPNVCVRDECYQYTNHFACIMAKENDVPCVWIDNHCEVSTECKNSQTVNSEGEVECRDGCFKNTANSSTVCELDPCASSGGSENQCIAQSNFFSGYVCKWNETERNCRAEDSCKTVSGKCAEGCRTNANGTCKPNVCVLIPVEEMCKTFNNGECTYLGEDCVWNDCQIANPKTETCPRGCAKNTNVSIVQCEPDACVKDYWPTMDCKGSDRCVIEETVTFGSHTCVYDPEAAKSKKKDDFPWWVILVCLLVVAGIAVVVVAVGLFVWKKKKSEKFKAKIEDVGGEEVRMRDDDAYAAENLNLSVKGEEDISAMVECNNTNNNGEENSIEGESVGSLHKSKKSKYKSKRKGHSTPRSASPGHSSTHSAGTRHSSMDSTHTHSSKRGSKHRGKK